MQNAKLDGEAALARALESHVIPTQENILFLRHRKSITAATKGIHFRGSYKRDICTSLSTVYCPQSQRGYLSNTKMTVLIGKEHRP
jgi:hypothetical protein